MTDLPEKNKPTLNDIPLESGVNDCRWNCQGKCTNPEVTRNTIPEGFIRDWDSKQNCPLTITGVIYCSGFEFEPTRNISGIYKFIRVKRKGRANLRQVIKMILCDEFTGIGEELVDNIEEDMLEALGMEKKGGADVSPQVINYIERGHRDNVQDITMQKIANALQVKPSELSKG